MKVHSRQERRFGHYWSSTNDHNWLLILYNIALVLPKKRPAGTERNGTIRDAKRTDAKLLIQLIEEMGSHQTMLVSASEKKLMEESFGPMPKFRALIAETETKVAGCALFFDHYSSFEGCGIFLEDPFVREDFRGMAVGRALLSRIAAGAAEFDYFGICSTFWTGIMPHWRFLRVPEPVLSERRTLWKVHPLKKSRHGLFSLEQAGGVEPRSSSWDVFSLPSDA